MNRKHSSAGHQNILNPLGTGEWTERWAHRWTDGRTGMTSLWRFAVKGSVHKDYTSPLLQRKKYTFKAILVSFKEIEFNFFLGVIFCGVRIKLPSLPLYRGGDWNLRQSTYRQQGISTLFTKDKTTWWLKLKKIHFHQCRVVVKILRFQISFITLAFNFPRLLVHCDILQWTEANRAEVGSFMAAEALRQTLHGPSERKQQSWCWNLSR